MTVGPEGGQGAEGTPAPAGNGTPAPGESRDPAEMLGEAVEGGAEGGEGGSEPDYKAEAAKWKALSRKNETRAKENATAAQKLAEIEQAQMSEVEKANARAQAAEERASAAEQQHFRTMAVAKYDLDPELIDDLGSGTEDEIDARAERLAAIINRRVEAAGGQAPVNGGVGPQFRTRPVESLRPGGAPAGDNRPKNSNDMFRDLIGRSRQ